MTLLNLSQPVAAQTPFVSPKIKTSVAKLYRDAEATLEKSFLGLVAIMKLLNMERFCK